MALFLLGAADIYLPAGTHFWHSAVGQRAAKVGHTPKTIPQASRKSKNKRPRQSIVIPSMQASVMLFTPLKDINCLIILARGSCNVVITADVNEGPNATAYKDLVVCACNFVDLMHSLFLGA